ncbi:MAG: transcriptional repressor [Firmicutes bacterium]|nr:transcriptional repressor [Bacillota bacterium]
MSDQLAAEILKEHSLKQTAGRLAILLVLIKAGKPLSHKDICSVLGDHFYDPVSVYRSLDSFVEAGFVHRVEDDNRTRLFALCTCEKSSHCHPHFFCRRCGKCECLKKFDIPAISELQQDYIVEEQRYYLKGVCSCCSKSGS